MGAGNSGFPTTDQMREVFNDRFQDVFLTMVQSKVSEINKEAETLIEEDFKHLATHFKVKFTKVNLGENPRDIRLESLFCQTRLDCYSSDRNFIDRNIREFIHRFRVTIEQELVKRNLERAAPQTKDPYYDSANIVSEEKRKAWDLGRFEADYNPFYWDNLILRGVKQRLAEERERKNEYALEIYYKIPRSLIEVIPQTRGIVVLQSVIKVFGIYGF